MYKRIGFKQGSFKLPSPHHYNKMIAQDKTTIRFKINPKGICSKCGSKTDEKTTICLRCCKKLKQRLDLK